MYLLSDNFCIKLCIVFLELMCTIKIAQYCEEPVFEIEALGMT